MDFKFKKAGEGHRLSEKKPPPSLPQSQQGEYMSIVLKDYQTLTACSIYITQTWTWTFHQDLVLCNTRSALGGVQNSIHTI